MLKFGLQVDTRVPAQEELAPPLVEGLRRSPGVEVPKGWAPNDLYGHELRNRGLLAAVQRPSGRQAPEHRKHLAFETVERALHVLDKRPVRSTPAIEVFD